MSRLSVVMCNSSELWSLQEAFQWLLSVKVGKASKETHSALWKKQYPGFYREAFMLGA